VLVVDLSDEETAKLLAVLDPLADMAEANRDVLAELIAEVETENEAVRALLDGMLAEGAPPDEDGGDDDHPPPEKTIPEAFQVVVDCTDEGHQQEVYERLTTEGLSCRLLTL
jgi:hypothetical protein